MIVSAAHCEKYAGWLQLIAKAKYATGKDKSNLVIVDRPWALGDTHEEVMINLSLLAEAGLYLAIVNPNKS
jgi:hypothetical protein